MGLARNLLVGATLSAGLKEGEPKQEVHMSLSFADYLFSEPERLPNWKPPYLAGIYAILLDEPAGPEGEFRPIYFGETNDLSESGLIQQHPLHDCWYKQIGSVYRLYIAIHEMADSSSAERQGRQKELITQYRPICNEPTPF